MRFLHMTDIHYLNAYPKAESGYLSIFKEMTNPIRQIEKGLEQVDLENIDSVLITGDLVECGKAEDYRQLKIKLKEIFKEIPIIVTLGNHDNKAEFYKGWLEIEKDTTPYHTVTKIENVTIIGFDISDEVKQDGLITSEHCEWLEKALEEAEGTDILLMIHHHLLPEQATIPAVAYDDVFYQIIEKSKITAILSGHTHHAYQGKFAGKDYFTAQNLSFSGIDEYNGTVRFEEHSGFNECLLKDSKVAVREIAAITDKKLLAKVKF